MTFPEYRYQIRHTGSTYSTVLDEGVFGLGWREVTSTETVSVGGLVNQRGEGSIFNVGNNVLMAVGEGSVWWNGRRTNVGVTQSTPYYILPRTNNPSDKYIIDQINGYGFPVGLDAPATPDVLVSTTGGKLNGDIRVQVALYNTETGDVSIPCDSTPLLSFPTTGAKLLISFPNAVSELGSTGKIKYRVYATKTGETTSSLVFFTGINLGIGDLATIGSSPYAALIDWSISDLQDEIPFVDASPPPPAKWGFVFGNVVVLLGGEDGTAFAVSRPNYPGMFPFSFYSFLPEPITGVVANAATGVAYVLCPSSIHIASFTGAADVASVIPRQVTTQVGMLASKNGTLVGQNLYGFTREGMFRLTPNGELDMDFCLPVKSDTRWWNQENVVVGYDVATNSVVYFHGWGAFSYNLTTERWSSFIDLRPYLGGEITVVNAYTYNNALHFSFYTPYTPSEYSSINTNNWFNAAQGFTPYNQTYQVAEWDSGLYGTYTLWSTGTADYVFSNLTTPMKVCSEWRTAQTFNLKTLTTVKVNGDGGSYILTIRKNRSGVDDGWGPNFDQMLRRGWDDTYNSNSPTSWLSNADTALRLAQSQGESKFFTELVNTIAGFFTDSLYTSKSKTTDQFITELYTAFFQCHPSAPVIQSYVMLANTIGPYSSNKVGVTQYFSKMFSQDEQFRLRAQYLYYYHYNPLSSQTYTTYTPAFQLYNDRARKINFRNSRSFMVQLEAAGTNDTHARFHSIDVMGVVEGMRK